jgi:hypothetical protein
MYSLLRTGSPGAGKTVLASSVIEDWEDHTLSSDYDHTFCYYFFSSESANPHDATALAAYRAILAQILQQHRNNTYLMEKFAFASFMETAQLKASTSELVDLLMLCCRDLERIYIVLDGIDECSDSGDLIQTLRTLMSSSPIKILFFSRINVPCLSRALDPTQRMPVNRIALTEDIRSYLSDHVASLMEDELLPLADVPELVDHLIQGADGMFLWAKLMINYLNLIALTPVKRLETIRQVILPEGLEKMYDRILSLIANNGKTERHLAEQIFAWIIYSKVPLTIRQLYEATHHDETGDEASIYQPDAAFREAISTVCGCLVECRIQSNQPNTAERTINDVDPAQTSEAEPRVQFIHLSIKEYFSQIQFNKGEDSVIPSEPVVHLDLARCCLQSLVVPSPPSQSSVQSLSFSRYSVLYWVDHLEDSAKPYLHSGAHISIATQEALRKLFSTLSAVLRNPKTVSSWISSYYAFAQRFIERDLLPDVLLPLNGLARFIRWVKSLNLAPGIAEVLKCLSPTLEEFVTDMQELDRTWGKKLRQSPNTIWDEASAFMSSRFLLSNTSMKVTSLAPKAVEDSQRSSRPLCTISATAADSSLSAVLSIWPSKRYEERWQDLKPNEAISRVEDVCTDWIARYEVWNLHTKQKIADMRIPLDNSEVWLHMRQSLYEKTSGEWSTSFPAVISNDVRSFVILRTLFVFHVPTTTTAATYQKAVLKIDFAESHQDRWTKCLKPFNPLDDKIRDRPLKWIHRDRYTYTITLSPNSRYLSFMDYDLSTNLAIFEIILENTLRTEFIGHITGGVLSRSSFKTAFHPSEDLIAISSATVVCLWAFREGRYSLSPLCLPHRGRAFLFDVLIVAN